MPWLMKTEPEEYGLDDLKAAGVGRWDGVRNYKARNHMNACRVGDTVLIYHSGKNPAVVGTATVEREAYPDPAQFDPTSDYFDAASDPDAPRWVALDLRYESSFSKPVTLRDIKAAPQFAQMELLKVSRLSVSHVTADELAAILELAG